MTLTLSHYMKKIVIFGNFINNFPARGNLSMIHPKRFNHGFVWVYVKNYTGKLNDTYTKSLDEKNVTFRNFFNNFPARRNFVNDSPKKFQLWLCLSLFTQVIVRLIPPFQDSALKLNKKRRENTLVDLYLYKPCQNITEKERCGLQEFWKSFSWQ